MQKISLNISDEDLSSFKEAISSLAYQDAANRMRYYQEEELARFTKAREATTNALEEAFAVKGVNFLQEIFPLFQDTYKSFESRFAAAKAVRDMTRQYQKRIKRYARAVAILTEEGSPLPQVLLTDLKALYSLLQSLFTEQFEKKMFQQMELLQKDIIDFNFTKDPHKHPAWQQLESRLFDLLKQKNVSDTQAYKLIVLLFQSYIPHWFDVYYPEDTVRLGIQSRSKKQHSKAAA